MQEHGWGWGMDQGQKKTTVLGINHDDASVGGDYIQVPPVLEGSVSFL